MSFEQKLLLATFVIYAIVAGNDIIFNMINATRLRNNDKNTQKKETNCHNKRHPAWIVCFFISITIHKGR
jgi:hypothetical protein